MSRAGNGAARSSTTSTSPVSTNASTSSCTVASIAPSSRCTAFGENRLDDERALLAVRGIVLGDHVLFLRRDA